MNLQLTGKISLSSWTPNSSLPLEYGRYCFLPSHCIKW